LLVHTVTKVLVVFAAVLAVLLAALAMAYSVNVDRVAGDYRAETDRRAQADVAAQTAIAQAREFDLQRQQLVSQLRNQETATATKISQLEAERAQLIAAVRAAEAARDAIAGQTAQALASNNTLTQINKTYAEEVARLRDSELARSRREIELVDRINDLESQREVLDSSVRALREQLAEAHRTIQASGASIRTTGANQPYAPSINLRGRVVRVSPDPATGRPMATINIGANDQVRENMELVITRNGQFLGNFIVTKTDLQWSMGNIDTLNRQVQIQEGDIVSTLSAR
jgi:hypothetical protein